ncbi:MAG TPA: TIGR03435 family protein [Vicinamibacterales bacterium]|nr:TIGR03435 family protein [Vicinamibacterales bacterium]
MGKYTSLRCIVFAAVVLFSPPMRSAQLEFDVASIKENTSLDAGGNLRLMPGGGLRAQHMNARSLVTVAYQLQPYQLLGAPDWTRNTYYDVEAKPRGEATREQTFAMLQTLLVERFQLALHRETREIDGFALVRARADRLGPNLRRSEVDCEKVFATTPRCRQGGITLDTMRAVGSPMWSVVQLVISKVGAPVSDETGLAGPYDVELRWSDELVPTDDRQSIYTALQEQLGLRLERRRVMTEVMVVDRMERATQN